ncbi:MAG TPA: DHHA1 domain-containing protein [Symbiobacteriaceae bacterium]|nr:DHHA1 domain-containing protein [Symbiobacteriaceae bacterium]
MPTVKLYHADAYRTEFTAQVRSCVPAGDKWDVILDQTCFYATAGGQPNDLGTLGGARVLDVREDEAAGEIIHTVDGPLSGEVRGEIDWQRRLDHSEQHTGQHLLSGVFERQLDGETVSWHLGTDSCSVDIAIEALNTQQAEQIELECNRVIRENRPVVTHVVDKEAVLAFPMRKPPAVEGDIRVVEIQDYDWSGCGGTHVRSTGELGLLKVKSWEKNKKFVRVEFLVGQRALRDYMRLDLMTRELARSLSIHVLDLPGYVDRSKEETSGLRKQLKMAQERLLEIEAAELVAEARKIGGAKVVRHLVGGRPVDEVKLLAGKVAAHPGTVAIFGTKGAIPQIVLYRAVDLRLDMGAVIRQVLPMIDGKGGGSPVQAQGAGSRPEALEAALDSALAKITEMLVG